jgi:hypothetical protein
MDHRFEAATGDYAWDSVEPSWMANRRTWVWSSTGLVQFQGWAGDTPASRHATRPAAETSVRPETGAEGSLKLRDDDHVGPADSIEDVVQRRTGDAGIGGDPERSSPFERVAEPSTDL